MPLLGALLGSASVDVAMDNAVSFAADILFGAGFLELYSLNEYLLVGGSSTTLVDARITDKNVAIGLNVSTASHLLGTGINLIHSDVGSVMAADCGIAAEISADGFAASTLLFVDRYIAASALLSVASTPCSPSALDV